MKTKEFMALVKKMRQAQKDYFATRAPGYLNLSRKYEKQVDAELDAQEEGPSLFDPGNGAPFRPTQEHLEALKNLTEGYRLQPYEWEKIEELWQGLQKL